MTCFKLSRAKELARLEKKAFPGFKRIEIRIIPRGCMRQEYSGEGCWGDYWVDEKDTLQVRAWEFKNLDFSFYAAMHELLEAWRCYRKGIKLEDIEKWDANHADHEDPGTIREAPYHREHMQSMTIEEIMLLQDGYDPMVDYENPETPA